MKRLIVAFLSNLLLVSSSYIQLLLCLVRQGMIYWFLKSLGTVLGYKKFRHAEENCVMKILIIVN